MNLITIEKLIWLFSLWPIIVVFNKIHKKKELSAFDILIIFDLIYYAFVPLISDVDKFCVTPDNYFKISTENTIVSMLFFNAFMILVVFVSKIWDKSAASKKNNLITTTVFLKNWSKNFVASREKLLLWWFLLLLQLYIRYISGEALIDAYGDVNKVVTPDGFIKYLPNLGQALRVILSVLLTVYIVNKRNSGKLNIIEKFTIVAFMLHIVTLSRTFQIEMILSCALVIYALKREFFTKKHFYYIVLVSIFLYFIVFPALYFYRSAVTYYMLETKQISYSLVNIDAINYALDHNFTVEDNKETRKTFIYTAFAKSIERGYNDDKSLTLISIEHGIPSFLLGNKTTLTSEDILASKLSSDIDLADSLLLFASMDYGAILGPLGAFLILMFLFWFWNKYYLFFRSLLKNSLVDLYFFYQLLTYCERTEISPDDYIMRIFQSILTIFVLYLISFVYTHCVEKKQYLN